METKIIYAVNSGCYSDYRVDALFDSLEAAEKYMQTFDSNYYNEVETYTLNPFSKQINEGLKPFCVRMEKNGDSEVEPATYGLNDNVDIGVNFYKNNRDSEYRMVVRCFAKTESHAVKIANEKRVQLIESNQFGIVEV